MGGGKLEKNHNKIITEFWIFHKYLQLYCKSSIKKRNVKFKMSSAIIGENESWMNESENPTMKTWSYSEPSIEEIELSSQKV